MFLPSFPNSTLNLFLEAPYVPLVPSNHSLQCRQDIGHGPDWAEVGEGGLGPRAYNFSGIDFARSSVQTNRLVLNFFLAWVRHKVCHIVGLACFQKCTRSSCMLKLMGQVLGSSYTRPHTWAAYFKSQSASINSSNQGLNISVRHFRNVPSSMQLLGKPQVDQH